MGVLLLLSPGMLLMDSTLELLPGPLELVDNMLVGEDAIRVLENIMLVGEGAIREVVVNMQVGEVVLKVLVDNILVGEDAIRLLGMPDNTKEREGDHTRARVLV